MRDTASVKLNLCILAVALTLLFYIPAISADSVSTKTYRELTKIQELMAGSDEKKPQLNAAIERLKILLVEVEEGSLDQALTLQTLGYAVMSNENFAGAIRYLKRSLDTEKLPQNVVYNVGYMVAQLHAALGEFEDALTFAETWFMQLEEPKADQYIFMANIHAQVKNHSQSIPYAVKAISLAEKPKATWFQLLAANHYELRQYSDAAQALIRMTTIWPDKSSYWEQLAGVYMVMEKPHLALATLKIAFQSQILDKESSLRSLVQLALMQGIPEHAARLLDAAMSDQLLPETAEYLRMEAQAWTQARESNKAIITLQKLAEIEADGDAWMQIAQIQLESSRWAEAELATQNALGQSFESPGKAWLILGIAQSELGKFDDAREALRKAAAFDSTSKSAKAWMRYSSDMKRQADWIAANR